MGRNPFGTGQSMEKSSNARSPILAILAFCIYALSSIGCSTDESVELTREQLDSLTQQVNVVSDSVVTGYISTEQGLREHPLTWKFGEKEIVVRHSSGHKIFKVLSRNKQEYYTTNVDLFTGIVNNLSVIRRDNWISVGLVKYYIDFDPPISEEPRIVVSKVQTHLVAKNENYTKLAEKYGLPIDTLRARNHFKELKIGQTIRIDK